MRPAPAAVALIAATLVGLSAAPRAAAEDKKVEAAARDALKKAEADYASKSFDRAIAALEKAAKACGDTKCTTETRASLARDIGAMHDAAGRKEQAAQAFAEALRLLPEIQLNPAYDTPYLRAAWRAAKKKPTGPAEPQPTGDFTHAPAGEQRARTALPVYAEYGGTEAVTKVVVMYKPEGRARFERLELARMGAGWGGQIPCADVTLGTMRYFLQGFNAAGDPVINSGYAKSTFSVPIRESITSDAPSLPGKPAPSGCQDATPTPVEEAPKGDAPKPRDGSFSRLWIGAWGSVDVVILPSARDVCKLNAAGEPAHAAGWRCTTPQGGDFPSHASPAENDSLVQGSAGAVSGGLATGNTRALASIDYAPSASVLLGARLGYVGGTFPGQVPTKGLGAPLHLELRGTLLFGDEPLARAGFAPLAFLGAGITQSDASFASSVVQKGIAGLRTMTAWMVGGPVFATVGAGGRYAFSPRLAVIAAVGARAAVGGPSVFFALAPEIGLQIGL